MAGKWLSQYKNIEPVNTKKPRLQLEPADETAEAIRQIYAGTYRRNCLLSVKADWQYLWGPCCWICHSEKTAAELRANPKVKQHVFTIEEFKLCVELAQRDPEASKRLLEGKKFFNGEVFSLQSK